MKKQALIIGAGASGMTAAIHAARAGARVTLLEHKDSPGKKILSTGNGRCNLTNLDQKQEYYRCGRPGFVEPVLEKFSLNHTLDFFKGLGILPKSRNGYLYPNSDQASSVLEALVQETRRLGVKTVCRCHVQKAEKRERQFVVTGNGGTFFGDCLVLAAGSRAAPVTGSDGSGYELAAGFGHRILTPLPALVQLRCQEKHYKKLSGVRTQARVSIYGNGRFLAEDTGELQLTDYGISGIPVFQVSRYASLALHKKQKVSAVINFFPQMSEGELRSMMEERRQLMEDRTWGQWMNGLLNSKLSSVLLNLAGISETQKAKTVTEGQWKRLMNQVAAYETTIVSANSFENAQVCCGGVDTKQIVPETLESRLVKDLFFCGEILDVDGICGGYNLQWAWSSGAIAGQYAAGKDRK